MDEIRDKLKTTEKEETPSPDQLTFCSVMQDKTMDFLPTKAEQDKATQLLIDKKMLGSLVLVGDARKANPFRTKSTKKKKKLRELEKLGEEVLANIPAEKLARLLEGGNEEIDASAPGDSLASSADASLTSSLGESLNEDLKVLLDKLALVDEREDDEDKQEIAVLNPAANGVKTSLPAGTAAHRQSTPQNQSAI